MVKVGTEPQTRPSLRGLWNLSKRPPLSPGRSLPALGGGAWAQAGARATESPPRPRRPPPPPPPPQDGGLRARAVFPRDSSFPEILLRRVRSEYCERAGGGGEGGLKIPAGRHRASADARPWPGPRKLPAAAADRSGDGGSNSRTVGTSRGAQPQTSNLRGFALQ